LSPSRAARPWPRGRGRTALAARPRRQPVRPTLYGRRAPEREAQPSAAKRCARLPLAVDAIVTARRASGRCLAAGAPRGLLRTPAAHPAAAPLLVCLRRPRSSSVSGAAAAAAAAGAAAAALLLLLLLLLLLRLRLRLLLLLLLLLLRLLLLLLLLLPALLHCCQCCCCCCCC
jgi:hypothetical protein